MTRKVFWALPSEVLAALFQFVAAKGGADFRGASRFLAEKGHYWSSSALHRHLSPLAADLQLLRRGQFVQAAATEKLDLGVAMIALAVEDLSQSTSAQHARKHHRSARRANRRGERGAR